MKKMKTEKKAKAEMKAEMNVQVTMTDAAKKDVSSVTELFDLTDAEWDRIASNAAKARRECDNMHEIAKRLGIIGGGPLAVNAYLFGRMVEHNESADEGGSAASSFKEMLQTLATVQKIKEGESISGDEKREFLASLSKLLDGKVKK